MVLTMSSSLASSSRKPHRLHSSFRPSPSSLSDTDGLGQGQGQGQGQQRDGCCIGGWNSRAGAGAGAVMRLEKAGYDSTASKLSRTSSRRPAGRQTSNYWG